MYHRFIEILIVVVLIAGGLNSSASDPPSTSIKNSTTTQTSDQLAFFEKKIRPVLVEHCYSCHSSEAASKNKLKGGLQVDSREGLLTGGDSGPALVPGNPQESLLIRSLHYDDDVRMPPKGKLPENVVRDFEEWVRMGAPDPRQTSSVKRQVGMSIEDGRKFWSYRPLTHPEVPAVKDESWPKDALDRFILAKLESKGFRPAPDVDRVTLIRRIYFDLVGLPPSPEEIDAFVNDPSPDAYEKLVDSLLARREYGERWGRHWLDVARFAESVTLRGLIFKEAWRYRDYVIDAFNQDMPFDRFIKEQIAGDLLLADSPLEKRRQIIATTFLTLGNHNLEEQDKKQLRMDVVDEQLDVIGKGFLAQTITCARCHDHKFDPIPTKDYYALAGILRNVQMVDSENVSRWTEVPLPGDDKDAETLKKYQQQLALLEQRIASLRKQVKEGTNGQGMPAVGVLAVENVPGIVVDDAQAKKVGNWTKSTYSKTYIGEGYVHDQNAAKGDATITFDPEIPVTGKYEVWLAYSPGSSRASNVAVTVFSADGEKTLSVDMKKTPPIDGRFLSLGSYRFEKTGQSYVIVSNEGANGVVTADAVTFLSAQEVVEKAKTTQSASATRSHPATDELRKLEAELKQLKASGPKIARAMSVVEEKTIDDTRVHIRGSVHNLGDVVPRGFLQVATAGPQAKMPNDQSGRVQLADWIASPENPLTSRVIVNRVWCWLFGEGIVRTVDNFGTTGEKPSHPELLDFLAHQFLEDDWSIKRLVRRLVLSRTYLQSSRGSDALMRADPENRLFGRANRRRLEGECLRDAMLVISGQMEPFHGGPNYPSDLAADYNYKTFTPYRSVYQPMFRNSIPEILEVFDMADLSMVTGKRTISTVSPQALFMMNNPFVVDQAQAAANRLLKEPVANDAERISRAFRRCLGRDPTSGERAVVAKFIASQSADPVVSWTAVFQSLFASADFRYVE